MLRFDDAGASDRLPELLAETKARPLTKDGIKSIAWAFRNGLELLPSVAFYARNDRLDFTIPYDDQRIAITHTPDYLARLNSGVTVVLEINGAEDDPGPGEAPGCPALDLGSESPGPTRAMGVSRLPGSAGFGTGAGEGVVK